MLKKFILSASLMLILVSVPLVASKANLLITPLQVVMEGRNRSAQVVLVNNSDKTKTYKLSWEQVVQTGGTTGYIDEKYASKYGITPPETKLSEFAVFTPKQVTLAPGEKQTVRVAVRRPAELADGEYRSHLKFAGRDVQEEQLQGRVGDDGKVHLSAQIDYTFSIPVIYRVGDYDINIDLGAPSFRMNDMTGKLLADIQVNRSGNNGVIGTIQMYHTPAGGSETLVGTLMNTNIFPEISMRQFTVPMTVSGLSPGSMRVVFKKTEGDSSTQAVLDELIVPITN